MKILLFTHKSDIDGMGSAVLAKFAFDDVEYVLCETFSLQQEIDKYYKNGSIYNYDRIFVTDMWLEEPMLSRVVNDKRLNDKIFVFDHHKSALKNDSNAHSFITLKISDEKGLCSGTSLFYEYLVEIGFIDRSVNIISEFSELTRRYDTWEWKTKYNDEMPRKLALLFDSVGCEGYIELMYQKLCQNDKEYFYFNELEEMLINNKLKQVQEKLENYSKKVQYLEIMGLRAGVVFIDYEYRNDLAEYFKVQGFDMDLAILVALDYGTISYRSVKDGVNVRIIAEVMGGKGHDVTASSPILENQKDAIVKVLLNK